MDHEVDPYRINIQSRDRDMANCGDGEAFRDSDRAPARLAKSRLIGNVPCRLPDAMRWRIGRVAGTSGLGIDLSGPEFFLTRNQALLYWRFGNSSMLIRGGTAKIIFGDWSLIDL
jgi:hypothetical protein